MASRSVGLSPLLWQHRLATALPVTLFAALSFHVATAALSAGGPYHFTCTGVTTLTATGWKGGSPVRVTWYLYDQYGANIMISWWDMFSTSTNLAEWTTLKPGTGPYLIVVDVNGTTAQTHITVPKTCAAGTGNPHFVGAHGTHFDFNGNLGSTYCLISDIGLHVNAKLKGYTSAGTVGSTVNAAGKGTRSWMGELGFIWTEHGNSRPQELHLIARMSTSSRRGAGFLASALLNGKPIHIPNSPGAFIRNGDLALTFMGTRTTKKYDSDRFRLTIKDTVDVVLDVLPAVPQFQQPQDSYVHFDLHISDLKASSKVHGVLGQTFRNSPAQLFKAVKYQALAKLLGEPIKADGASGFGFLDGTVGEYASSGILKPDCERTAFARVE